MLTFDLDWERQCYKPTLTQQYIGDDMLILGSPFKIKRVNLTKKKHEDIYAGGNVWQLKSLNDRKT